MGSATSDGVGEEPVVAVIAALVVFGDILCCSPALIDFLNSDSADSAVEHFPFPFDDHRLVGDDRNDDGELLEEEECELLLAIFMLEVEL